MKRLWWIAILILILAVAAYLRLYNIQGYMTFLGDEGRDVLVVKRMIVDHKFTLLGPTASVGGFFLGPVYYYFMLPFLWAWNLNPVGPAVMVGLFGVATVGLVFMVGRILGGLWSGLIASSLYAVSPLVIAYSRSSWNPNLVPFFSLLTIYLLLKAKGPKWFVGVGICLGIGLQLHYLFLFMIVVVGIWMAGKKEFKGILYTIIGFLIGYSPFLAFELRHGFPNTQTVIRFVLSGQDTGIRPGFFTIIDDVSLRAFGRLLFRLPDGGAWEKLPLWQLYAWFITIRVTIFAGIIALLRKRLTLPFIWLGLVLVLFGFYQKGIYDYYFGIIFPLPFLLVGILLTYFWKHTAGKVLGVLLWTGLLVFNWQGSPFLYPPNNQLAQARAIATEALSHTEGKPFNFALIATGNSDHVYRYFFEIAGRAPVTIENQDVDPERKSVTDQLIVICETNDCKPLGHPLWEIAGFGRAEITGTWEVPFVKIFRLVHYKGT